MTTMRRLTILVALFAGAHQPLLGQDVQMNFFITSQGLGDGANLGGLEGADGHCAFLAYNVGFGDMTWRAYLSATGTDGSPAVHARDRIGTGPFYNYYGVLIAETVDQLHGEANNLNRQTAVTEKGDVVAGRGDSPNHHDILTGSRPDGRAYPPGQDTTCDDWTSNGAGSARVGHHDRTGGGEFPESWNSAHGSRGCSQENLQSTGGNGLFYCFGF